MTERRVKQSLGDLELDVMKVVWDTGGCSVQEATEILGQRRDYARTTILTVIQRLYAKGFLQRRKVDGVYEYSSTEDRGTVLSRLIARFVDTVLDGSPEPLVTYFAEHSVGPAESVAIRDLLARAEDGDGSGRGPLETGSGSESGSQSRPGSTPIPIPTPTPVLGEEGCQVEGRSPREPSGQRPDVELPPGRVDCGIDCDEGVR